MLNELNNISIAAESPHSDEALALLECLRAELQLKYPDEVRDEPFRPEELAVPGATFLIARSEGVPVGCGAVRPLAPGVAEVKRMYVTRAARGKGIGRRLLDELEATARRLGYRSIRLETGLKQPEAIALYETAGFHRVTCYGEYVENAMSVCFEKRLSDKL